MTAPPTISSVGFKYIIILLLLLSQGCSEEQRQKRAEEIDGVFEKLHDLFHLLDNIESGLYDENN